VPALVLNLQSTAGNAAVTELVGTGALAVQRKAATHKGRKKPPTDAEVNAAADAISAVPAVLSLFHNMVAEYQMPDIPSTLPPQYANMLWDFWKATVGADFSGGSRIHLTGQDRLARLDIAVGKLKAAAAVYRAGAPAGGAGQLTTVLNGQIMPAVERVRADCYVEAADAKAKAAEAGIEVKGPEREAEEHALREAVAHASSELNKLNEAIIRFGEEKLEHVIEHMLEHDHLPISRGARPVVVLVHLRAIIDSVNVILAATNHEEREKLFAELAGKEGAWAGIAAGTELLTGVTKLTGGVLAAASIFAGGLAKLSGQAEAAARCFAQVGGVLGKVSVIVTALEVVHGTLVLCDPHATPEQKADAVVAIASGGVGLLGTAGVISGTASGAATLGITITWFGTKKILQQAAGMVSAIFENALHGAYDRMKVDGDALAHALVHYAALEGAAHGEKDPKMQAGFAGAQRQVLDEIQRHLRIVRRECMRKTNNFNDAGHYGPLRERFERAGAVIETGLEERATAEQVIAAAEAVVEIMTKAYEEYHEIHEEAYAEYLRDRG
jgi:hypothetical protein